MEPAATEATFVAAQELLRSPLLGRRPVRLSTGEMLDHHGRPVPPGSDGLGYFTTPWLRPAGSAEEPGSALELEALADAERPLGSLADADAGFSEPDEPGDSLIPRFERRWGAPVPSWPSQPLRVSHLDCDAIEAIAMREGLAIGGADHVVCMFRLLTPEWRSYTTTEVKRHMHRAGELGVWHPPANIHSLFARLTASEHQTELRAKAAKRPDLGR